MRMLVVGNDVIQELIFERGIPIRDSKFGILVIIILFMINVVVK